MNELERILAEMQKIAEAVKAHQGDPATLNWEDVEAKFTEQINALVQKQVDERMTKMPQYRVPGTPQAHVVGVYENWDTLKSNRYAGMLKDFARDGFYKLGTQKVKPVDFVLARLLMEKAHSIMPDRVALPSDDLKAAIKAMTSTGAGTGDELVPTDLAATLWEDIFLASRIVANMVTIPMPTNPFDVPLGLGDVTWRKGTENTATTATDLATAKSTLTATELVAEVNWSYTLDEDAIIALMPAVRARLAQSGAEIVDAFALNADATATSTGNINLDDSTPNAASYYLTGGQDGIRHQWLVDNTAQGVNAAGAVLADAQITSMLAKMGKYAVNPDNVMMVADVTTYLKGFLSLDNTLTIDKFGPNAVVLTGQLGAYRGIPIVVSASAPLTEADGKVSNTPGNNTLGQISTLNRGLWYAGFRRDLLVEVDRDIQKRQFIMVVSLREAVAAHGTRATNTHTAGIYNILVS